MAVNSVSVVLSSIKRELILGRKSLELKHSSQHSAAGVSAVSQTDLRIRHIMRFR